MSGELEAVLARLVRLLAAARTEAVEDAANAVSDRLATGERGEDLVTEAILDGVRFGHRAAVAVELGGGLMVRILEPGGIRLTHEWGAPGAEHRRALVAALVAAIAGMRGREAER